MSCGVRGTGAGYTALSCYCLLKFVGFHRKWLGGRFKLVLKFFLEFLHLGFGDGLNIGMVRMLLIVILVVVFRGVKYSVGFNFGYNGVGVDLILCQLCDVLHSYLSLLLVVVIYCRTVLFSDIGPLPV